MSAPTLWRAALMSAPFSTLTYQTPPWLPESTWEPGLRVVVPMGGSLRLATLLERTSLDREALPEGVTIRDMLWPAEREPILGREYAELAVELARRQMVTPGRILGSILPKGLRSSRLKFTVWAGEGGRRSFELGELARLPQDEKAALARIWTGEAAGRMEVERSREAEAVRMVCVLTRDPPWPVRPGAKQQMAILDRLLDKGPVERVFLAKELGPGCLPALKTLMERGLVVERLPHGDEDERAEPLPGVAEEAAAYGADFELTGEQAEAARELIKCLGGGECSTRLLHGVTGSGKTAVYLELARACLEGGEGRPGRSALLLAPEVALAGALRDAAEKFFPDRKVFFYHGYQSARRREKVFRELAERREPALAIGARSALFLPMRDLGLIVLDEEHDSSFKQDERFLYQAKEIAWFRAVRSKALLVLGSATPDVKTYHAALSGRTPLLSMSRRVTGRELPRVTMVDMLGKSSRTVDGTSLSPAAVARLNEVVGKGEQAVIMLNRRGYSPLMYCAECGEVARCPDCQVGLTYHKNRERLICHYCGFALPFPSLCGKCGSSNWLPMGEGTQRIEEKLARLLPEGTKVLRLDRDSVRRQERLEEILRDFAEGRAQVLVGTQMLAKGHNFPGVTLVVAADGDMGLNLPDYRARERSFQLLSQVAGRAGRGEKPGEALVQTRNPGLPFWELVKRGDYAAFYEEEIKLREQYAYPPFVKLAMVRAVFPADWPEGEQAVEELAAALRRFCPAGVRALGPAPSPLSMLRGQKRFQILLKAADWPLIRQTYARLESCVERIAGRRGKLKLSLDLDPVNML